jgi:hypothetical protein
MVYITTIMKVFFLLIVVALLPFTLFTEKKIAHEYVSSNKKQNTLLKCNIKIGMSNDTSLTNWIKQDKVSIVIYTIDDELYLANVWSISNTQSFGVLTPSEPKALEHLVDRKGSTIEIFNWKYENTYDNEKGTSTVTFIKKGIDVIVIIGTEENDSLSFAGKIE